MRLWSPPPPAASPSPSSSPTKKARAAACDNSSNKSAAESAERSVWVAVRARPLLARERLEGAKACVSVSPEAGSVRLGNWRQFSYDFAFGPDAQQQEVYAGCVSSLAEAVLEGYNATVLAYGATASGKTTTLLGLGSALHGLSEHHGVIPRAIRQLFDAIAAAPDSTSFVVKAQFLEIYNEELRDLLAGFEPPGCSNPPAAGGSGGGSSGPLQQQQRSIAIRESPDGQIVVTGAREVTAGSAEELLRLLDAGMLTRATSGTLLNEQSSRSHAIFTISLEQSISSTVVGSSSRSGSSSGSAAGAVAAAAAAAADSTNEPGDDDEGVVPCFAAAAAAAAAAPPLVQVEYRCSKFHLVDLAGSERVGRSGALGLRFRETVNINQGLLALGNVIGALSDLSSDRRPRHVPYRDSKLTRLLQDSLGGNSKTLMIACVSSADDAVEESLNTLKYASRARAIRNRPVLNANINNSNHRQQQQQQCLSDGSGGTGPPAHHLLQQQQLTDLESKVAAAHQQLAVFSAEQQAVEQAATVLREQAGSAWELLLQEVEALHGSQQLSDAARQRLTELAQARQQQQQAGFDSLLESVKQPAGAAADALPCHGPSVHSHPLPEVQSSSCCNDQQLDVCGSSAEQPPTAGATAAAASAKQPAAGRQLQQPADAASSGGADQVAKLQQVVADLEAQLAQQSALLAVAQGDLSRDEQIFTGKVQEVAHLQSRLAAAAEHARQRDQEAAARMQAMHTELRRWRARAMAMQACPADPSQQQQQHVLPPPPSSPSCQARGTLQQELSFTALPKQQQQQQPLSAPQAAVSGSTAAAGQPTGQQQPQDMRSSTATAASVTSSLPQLQLSSSLGVLVSDTAAEVVDSDDDDRVLFDAELASYISDTDYCSDRRGGDFEVDSHLAAELQVVLADKAALEEEKAAAQAEAAAAQRAFEHSRAMLEGQLGQLSSAISSQEALIATLLTNETEAKNLGALYLERCRELEAQLTDLSMDLQELTSALTRVEADAAASAGEKLRLRREYESRIEGVVRQMEGLQQQMRQQDGARVEKERQRAAGRVQQLQAELSTMRSQQDSLRTRLQERLTAQEKDAAVKSRELASLRRAAESARKRVIDLELENKRQRAALKARSSEAAEAKRQLRELSSRSPVRSRPSQSPRASPPKAASTTFRVPPLAAATLSRASAAAASPRTPSRATPRTPSGPSHSVSPRLRPQPAGGTAARANAAASCSAASSELLQHAAAESGGASGDVGQRRSSSGSGGGSGSGSGSSRQLLTKHVQLLVSEYAAKHRLQMLQAKQGQVQTRRDQLLAATAQLQLRQLRRCSAATDSSSSSGGGGSDATDAVLLSDYTDQLDCLDAQLEHIQQLMHSAAAEAAAAADAAGQLAAAAHGMGREQLLELLLLSLKELALQAAECQQTVTQAKWLQLELTDAQQQLQETTCCLHMVQLQQQTQLSELQRQHEQRVMALLHQQQQQPADAQACASASNSGSNAAASAAATGCVGVHQSQQGTWLVGLLRLLAQQGTEEQRAKLNNTVKRLQQLQLQGGDQQQQQPGGEQQQAQPQQQQQHQPPPSPRQNCEQLQRLKQCRAQQQAQQLMQQLSPRGQHSGQQQQQQQQQQQWSALTLPASSGSSRRASYDCGSASGSGSRGSSCGGEDLRLGGVPPPGLSASTCAAAAEGSASLRASASRLQAKLCAYRPPQQQPLGAARSACSSPSASVGVQQQQQPDAPHQGATANSPTAAIFRRAAQLALRDSVELSRRPSAARLARQHLLSIERLSASSSNSADDSCNTSSSRSSVASAAAEASVAGGCFDSSGSVTQLCGAHSFRSSAGERSGSLNAAAAGSQPSLGGKLRSVSIDCLRPAALDVGSPAGVYKGTSGSTGSSSSTEQQQLSGTPTGRLRSPAVGSSRGLLDAPAPGSAASSPSGRHTARSLAATNNNSKSPGGGGCRSPYQQFKASAAAAAAAKDQQLPSFTATAAMTSPKQSRSSRRGLQLASSPSAYMRLQQLHQDQQSS